MENQIPQRSTHLREYLDVIIRRRWPIIAIFFTVCCLMAAYIFLTPKQYTASTLLLIEQSSSRPLSLQEALGVDSVATDFYQTQYRILESKTISELVIKRLGLEKLPEFGFDPKIQPPLDERAQMARTLEIFEQKRKIEPVRLSRLTGVSFTSLDPKLAAAITNTIAQVYIEYTMDRKLKVSQMAVNFLSKRIEEQRRKLEASQLSLQKFMEEQNLATAISDEYGTITAQKLADLRSDLVEAEATRKEAQARYQLAERAVKDPAQAGSIPELLESPVFQDVRKRELELSKQYAELSQRYGPKHPRIVGLKAEAAALAQDRSSEIRKVVNSLRQKYEISLAKEKALREALGKEREIAMDIRKKAIGYLVLKREVDTNQQLYDMLLSRAKEARVTEDIDVGTVSVVDKAEVPEKPSWPSIKSLTALGLVLGVILSLSFGLLLEYMDNTIKFPEQVQKSVGLPVLVHVPYSTSFHRIISKRSKDNQAIPDLIKEDDSILMESFRNLQTSVTLSRAQSPPCTIVITSPTAGEGKSFVAANLAYAYASSGERTLLLDSDLRKPRQHRLWAKSRRVGLSSLLTGTAKLEDTMDRDIAPNLDLMTSGPIPPNPTALLRSELFTQLVTAACKTYGAIIIDSPPVLPISDPSILASVADGVVLVTAAGQTPIHALQQTVEKLGQAGASIIGVVLNRSSQSKGDYYYRGYRYKYYYKYEYSSKKRGKPA